MAAVVFVLVTSLLMVDVSSVPLRPTKLFDSWFSVEQRPTVPFEAVQTVVDFPAGGFVPRHTHGGPLYAVTLDGAMTVWIEGEPAQKVHKGDPIVEPYRSISSASATAPSSLLATYLIPVGANVTNFEPTTSPPLSSAPPGPSSRFQSRLRLDAAPDQCYKVNLYLLSYAPGAWAAPEHVVAPRLSTVVSGAVTTSKRTFKDGEFWIQKAGEKSPASRNLGTERALVAVSILPV